jgi:hypothetical protein
MDIALSRVKKVALDTFTFGSVTLGVLFIALYAIFRSLVTRPLNRLSLVFRGIANGGRSRQQHFVSKLSSGGFTILKDG